jgi:hypothetical protein
MRTLMGIVGVAAGFAAGTPAAGAAPDERVDPYAEEPAAVAAARAKDVAFYASPAGQDARAQNDGTWMVIADGKLVVAADALEKVADAAPAALHRFVFRVGEEGDVEGDATTWYADRFAGPPFLRALGLGFSMGDGITLTKDGRSVTSEVKGVFPRLRLAISAPGPQAAAPAPDPVEVLVGTVGPELMLTPYDALRLHLARWEVPGTQSFFGGKLPCRRALVRVSVPGLPGDAVLTAAVPAVDRETLIAMQAGRDRFWQWGGGGPISKMPLEDVPDGDWIVFGNDRVLGHGPTPEAAVQAADANPEFTYHRFCLRVPVDLPPPYIAVGTQRPEPIAFDLRKFVKATGTLNGRRVEALVFRGFAPIHLVSKADARAMHLEQTESPYRFRVFDTDDPKAPPRYAVGGQAWTDVPVEGGGTRRGLALVLYERPKDASDDPIDWDRFKAPGGK